MMKYLVTENELLSAAIDPADGHLKFTRDNGQVIDAGKASGDVTPEALAARDEAVAAAAQAQTIALGDAATAWGFFPVYSETPPAETEMFGVPVVWMTPTGFLTDIPAIPEEPVWDHVAQTFMVGAYTGVQWVHNGQAVTPGVATPIGGTLPVLVEVEAVALPGYTMAAPAIFQEYFYDPNAVTLLASDGFGGAAALSVVGRTMDDEFGGTLTPAWTYDHVARTGATLGVDGSGHLVPTKEVADTWATKASAARLVDVGARDQRVEIDVLAMPNVGSVTFRACGISVSALAASGITLTLSKTASVWQFSVSGTNANLGTLFLVPSTDITSVVGVWTVDHIATQKTWRVVTPDGQEYRGTYTTGATGNDVLAEGRYGVSGATLAIMSRDGNDSGFQADSIKIYRIGGA